MRKFFAVLLVFAAFAGIARASEDAVLASLPKPPPGQQVVDQAGVFSPVDKAALESYLREIRDATTAEIAVVTVPTLDGGDINDFANKLFANWGIGKKDKDNGVLLVAAINDHRVRIEVGYGLEGALPDAKTGRILDEAVIPLFKAGNMPGGLIGGAQAIGAVVAQEYNVSLTNALAKTAPPVSTNAAAAGTGEGGGPGGVIALILFVGIFVLFIWLGRKFGGRTGPGGGISRGGGFGGGSSGGGFGGGRSGGGGASRGW